MEPETVHLIAQIIRHERGIWSALDRWVSRQPPSPSMVELKQVVEARRSMLLICERQAAGLDL